VLHAELSPKWRVGLLEPLGDNSQLEALIARSECLIAHDSVMGLQTLPWDRIAGIITYYHENDHVSVLPQYPLYLVRSNQIPWYRLETDLDTLPRRYDFAVAPQCDHAVSAH